MVILWLLWVKQLHTIPFPIIKNISSPHQLQFLYEYLWFFIPWAFITMALIYPDTNTIWCLGLITKSHISLLKSVRNQTEKCPQIPIARVTFISFFFFSLQWVLLDNNSCYCLKTHIAKKNKTNQWKLSVILPFPLGMYHLWFVFCTYILLYSNFSTEWFIATIFPSLGIWA